MRRAVIAFILILTLVAPPQAHAAGTVVTTERTHLFLKVVKFAWTSSAGGAADATTTGSYCGKLEHFVTVPDAVDAPTTLYDIVVTDADSVDVLAGAGANRSATVTEQVLSASLSAVCYSTLTLAVTNAGNAKKGTVYIYIR